MNFLRTVIVIIMIYYIIKIVTRFAFPHLVKRFMHRMEDKMKQQQGFNEKYDDSKIGETIIDKKPKDKTSNKDVGEYVDFEEVD